MKISDWIEEYKSEDGFNYIIPEYKIQRIYSLEARLKESEDVNRFYADKNNWCGNKAYLWTTIDQSDKELAVMDDDFDVPVSPFVGGKRAREYFKKVENEN